MQTYSKTIVIGHLAAEPRVVQTDSGKQVADFTVAVNDVFRRGTETVRTTTYVDWTGFGAFASLIAKLPVGTGLLLDGRIANSKWTDRHNQKRLNVKMVVERMKVLSKPGNTNEVAAPDSSHDTTATR